MLSGSLAASLVATVITAGCATSLGPVVAEKHYREALCGAVDGDRDDRTLVTRALRDDADLYLHVHVVSHDELVALLGPDAAPPIEARMSLVRVAVRSNDVPVDTIALGGALRGAGAVAEWNTLARATGEHGGAEPSYAPSQEFKKRTVMVEASRDEYRRTAPLAWALWESIDDRAGCHPTGDGRSIGEACEVWFVVDRAAREEVVLHLTSTFTASRIGVPRGTRTVNRVCSLTSESDVVLGPPADLATSVRRIWDGPNARRVSEIARK